MGKHDALRLHIFTAAVLVIFGLVGYRLFVLAYVHHDEYAQTAFAQQERTDTVISRGSIYIGDANGVPVLAATSRQFPAVVIIPSDVPQDKKDEAANGLASIVGQDQKSIADLIAQRDEVSHMVARRLTDGEAQAVTALGIKGVAVAYETERFYPGNELAANVLGFLGYQGNDRVGQYGIEAYYDAELSGKHGTAEANVKQPAWRTALGMAGGVFQSGSDNTQQNGSADIVLTIDKNIQSFAEQKLKDVIEKWGAAGGNVIVEEPSTGKILAMAEYPAFDPNTYGSAATENFLNSSVQEIFEPGSSFKPVTMSMGLNLNKVTPQTTYTDTGSREIAGYTIRNFSEKVFGTVDMTTVLEKSINTGAMFVAEHVGQDQFLNYVINMGFGQRTGVELPGEVSGDITNLYSGRTINYLTAAFGQGIAVTPLQLINAYSVIANGGKLMRPYIVDKVVYEGGGETVTQPEVVGIPIREKTASQLKAMLVSVVDHGFDKARISGYDVAGKTGTAQIPDVHGGYLEDEYIHDFVGFAPAYDARFVILIKLDRPHGIAFAADSLSPVFKEIAQYALNYYKVPPTR